MGKELDSSSATCSTASGCSTRGKVQRTADAVKQKLRVLCLHGYRQNGDMLKSKLGSFRKCVSQYAEFVFITAPHKAAPLEPGAEVPEEQRSWWFNKEDRSFKGTNKEGPAFGFHESLRCVEQAWQTQGPFQGLLGFSQGACFVGLICGLAEKKLTSIRPDFAIIAAGFLSGSLVHKGAYEETVSIPTMHIFGSSDDIIPMQMSQELMARFKNVEVLEHSGGHYFPATSATKPLFVNYFQDRLVEYLEHLELQNSANAFYIDDEIDDKDRQQQVSSDDDSD